MGSSQNIRECIAELNSIIYELNQIQYGVNNEFANVGNDRCARKIGEQIQNLRNVAYNLSSIPLNEVDRIEQSANEPKISSRRKTL